MATSRMLLSHNFDLGSGPIPALSREEFTAVFSDGFSDRPALQCQAVNNPHWILELKFDTEAWTPEQLGQACAQLLRQHRQQQLAGHADATALLPMVLILGGIKITPPTSDSPTALQTGEWGVDVVETANGDLFLESIHWHTTISQKDPTTIFKVVMP